MSIEPQRRQALVEAKLRALVRNYLLAQTGHSIASPEPDQPSSVADAATLWNGRDLWVYTPTSARSPLGRALGLATKNDAASLHLVVDDGGEDDARRAALVAMDAHVYRIDGIALVRVSAAPLATPADPPSGAHVQELVEMLDHAGVDVVVEHGVILGEIRGLEVARVRTAVAGELRLEEFQPTSYESPDAPSPGDPATSGQSDFGAVLDVGVGRFDQEAAALMHAHLPTAEALAQAVSLVREHRHRGAEPHPLNRLGRERWLRAQLIADPAQVGLSELVAISPPAARRNVKDPAPAAALGLDESGTVLLISTVGVDLEWLPFTVDLVDRERPTRVIVALPARDMLPVQHRLLALVGVPASLVAVNGDWPT